MSCSFLQKYFRVYFINLALRHIDHEVTILLLSCNRHDDTIQEMMFLTQVVDITQMSSIIFEI